MQILKNTEQILYKNFVQNLKYSNSTVYDTPPPGTCWCRFVFAFKALQWGLGSVIRRGGGGQSPQMLPGEGGGGGP